MKIIQLKREDQKTKAILKALEILRHQEVLATLYPPQKKRVRSFFLDPKNFEYPRNFEANS